MHVSLITSLYRGEAYLPTYGQHVKQFLSDVQQAGLDVEILVIANDPTERERALLAQLPVRVIETARETLYASWNRGIAAMQSDVFGVWNIDDERDAAGLVAGYTLMHQGYTLVDAPSRVIQTSSSLFRRQKIFTRPVYIHETQALTRKHVTNTFMLIHRSLFDAVGVFDPHFRIMGDLEWSGRARTIARIGVLSQPGGTYHLHGSNLSGTGNPRQMIEENIVFLRRQQWDEVRPTADPKAMREAWETWGNPAHIAVPEELAARLWGDHAREEWDRWQRDRARQMRQLAWRRRIRAVTDRLQLTPLLLRLRRAVRG